MDFRLTYSHYLVSLIAEFSAAQTRLAGLADPDLQPVRAAAAAGAARASAKLDGSPLEPATAEAVDAGRWPTNIDHGAQPTAGGWAAALRLEGMATQDVAAVEYANLLAVGAAQEDLAATLFDDPLGTLARLHGLICQGLVEPEVIGRPRRTEQAVHDGAQGMVIYNPAEPQDIPGLLDELAAWLHGTDREGSAALPAVVVAAVIHERLLQWQPYEAGNGRLARAAARLVLRARGVDPYNLVVPETFWAAAPGPYYAEVAATLRRRDDLTLWVERHTETLVAAAEQALGAFDGSRMPLSPRAARAAGALEPGQAITVAEYAQRWEISRETALADLRALSVWDQVVREPRTLGRRFRRL